jgi:hypothetical protein
MMSVVIVFENLRYEVLVIYLFVVVKKLKTDWCTARKY